MKSNKFVAAALPGTIALWIGAAPAAYAGFINESAPAVAPAVPVASTMTVAAIPASGVKVASAQDPSMPPLLPPEKHRTFENGEQFSQIGFHPDDTDILKGGGRDIDLSDMLRAVVPSSFHVEMGDVDPTLHVSWRGSLPWDTVLENAMKPVTTVHVTFDWDRKIVSLSQLAAPKKAVAIAALGASSASADPTIVPKQVWTLRQGYPIGQELEAWGKRAGWTVVWGLQRDVVAPSTTSFEGDFATAASDVIRTLAQNGALIHAQIFDGNHTLVVQGPGVPTQN